MKAIDLADMLKEQYVNQHVQCTMDVATCGDKSCDLCRIEQFAREVRICVIDDVLKILNDNLGGYGYVKDMIEELKEQNNE